MMLRIHEIGRRSVDHVLTTTREVRQRLDLERPVPLDIVQECQEIALQAPTGFNLQNWHWIIVTDAEKRRAIAEVFRRIELLFLQEMVPVHVFLCTTLPVREDREPFEKLGYETDRLNGIQGDGGWIQQGDSEIDFDIQKEGGDTWNTSCQLMGPRSPISKVVRGPR